MHGDVIAEDTTNCYLYSSDRLVAAVGLEDHVVVETKDAVLVAPRDRVQDVKQLVEPAQGRQALRVLAAPRGLPARGAATTASTRAIASR